MIPMYRLWLQGLYGLHGPRCQLSPKRLLNYHSHTWRITFFFFFLSGLKLIFPLSPQSAPSSSSYKPKTTTSPMKRPSANTTSTNSSSGKLKSMSFSYLTRMRNGEIMRYCVGSLSELIKSWSEILNSICVKPGFHLMLIWKRVFFLLMFSIICQGLVFHSIILVKLMWKWLETIPWEMDRLAQMCWTHWNTPWNNGRDYFSGFGVMCSLH